MGRAIHLVRSHIIVILVGYLEALMPGVLYNAVKSAHDQIPEFMDTLHITDALLFVVFANDLLRWTPNESFHGRDMYHILTVFYFIFDQPGLAELQNEVHPSQAGQQLTWLSTGLSRMHSLLVSGCTIRCLSTARPSRHSASRPCTASAR